MNNREYYFKLAHDDPHALAEWLDAEHVELRSAKRAAAVERLRDTWNAGIRDTRQLFSVVADTESSPVYATRFAYDNLIDLLTDDESHSKAHSKTEPSLSEQSESLSDEADSREKLEADIEKRAVHAETVFGPLRIGTVKVGTNVIYGWLDRQAEITKNECREEHRKRLGELHDLLDEAAREREELAWRVEYNGELVEKVKRERNNLQYENDALKGRISQFAAHETAETDETRATKEHIRDFDDTCEKLDSILDAVSDVCKHGMDDISQIMEERYTEVRDD